MGVATPDHECVEPGLYEPRPQQGELGIIDRRHGSPWAAATWAAASAGPLPRTPLCLKNTFSEALLARDRLCALMMLRCAVSRASGRTAAALSASRYLSSGSGSGGKVFATAREAVADIKDNMTLCVVS